MTEQQLERLIVAIETIAAGFSGQTRRPGSVTPGSIGYAVMGLDDPEPGPDDLGYDLPTVAEALRGRFRRNLPSLLMYRAPDARGWSFAWEAKNRTELESLLAAEAALSSWQRDLQAASLSPEEDEE